MPIFVLEKLELFFKKNKVLKSPKSSIKTQIILKNSKNTAISSN
ncbi:hypothetical protein LEP1GSC203_1132 [Leptospira terpstrae serovar Hualin str. LT 11-33 = ATCC 700639]|uniref:Uncharacterized protein n=1 Tax=Leptospira terpstrae serovar Hualin str. LT 11-33 = ATCC 700639 TaxID=1257025 RepID=N1VS59_9LEPT|nr:hypothetical protein LEP1GSC203_1132 [Leptospira terpstrae serovar Hualin str. LT 11-33 = ATCC 700639]